MFEPKFAARVVESSHKLAQNLVPDAAIYARHWKSAFFAFEGNSAAGRSIWDLAMPKVAPSVELQLLPSGTATKGTAAISFSIWNVCRAASGHVSAVASCKVRRTLR